MSDITTLRFALVKTSAIVQTDELRLARRASSFPRFYHAAPQPAMLLEAIHAITTLHHYIILILGFRAIRRDKSAPIS